MLTNDQNVLVILPELYAQEGGIQTIAHDVLTAIRQIRPEGEPTSVVVGNDGFTSEPHAREWGGAFNFTWCGDKGDNFRKAKIAGSVMGNVVRHRPSLIVCGHVNYAPICYWISRAFKVPYLVMTYGIDVWEIASKSQRIALQHAKMVTALSRYTAERLAAQVPFKDGRLVIQPHAVRPHFTPAAKSKQLAKKLRVDGRKVILTVSRLDSSEQYKGYDLVMENLASIAQAVPDVVYLIVGGGDDAIRIRKYAEKLGVVDRIVLAGEVPNEELPAYYNLADVFAMPSRNEGLGIVYLEALACGKPVIGGSTGGARDALLDGKLGWLVDPDDGKALADTIKKVLRGTAGTRKTDPEVLSKAAQRHFGFDGYIDRMASLFESCIDEPAVRRRAVAVAREL